MTWSTAIALGFGLLMLPFIWFAVIGVLMFLHRPKPKEVKEMLQRLREEDRKGDENW